MKKRGGYSGNLTHQIKVRVSPQVFKMLQDLSARRDITLAYIIREFIFNGLAALRT
jgi:predicted DNA-binding protein